MYAETGKELPFEDRPPGSVLTDCMEDAGTGDEITDEVINGVVTRWQQSKYLQNLYLDDLVSREYELFRARFVSQLSEAAKGRIVEPTLIQSSTISQDVHSPFKVSPTQKRPAQRGLPREDLLPGFKGSFHQSLCLHSMAVGSRKIARVLMGEEDGIIDRLIDLWAKKSVTIKGDCIPLSDNTKLQCLEVFDFLYLFLLKKAFPLEHLDLWTSANRNDWPYDTMIEDPESTDTERWYSFLTWARWSLQPHDFCDLVKNCENSDYPADKHMYMRERGLFDFGPRSNWDLFNCFEKFSMLDGLLPGASHMMASPHDNPHEEPCWWDHVRVWTGSPFHTDFLAKYLAIQLDPDSGFGSEIGEFMGEQEAIVGSNRTKGT